MTISSKMKNAIENIKKFAHCLRIHSICALIYIYIYIYICVCVCVCIYYLTNIAAYFNRRYTVVFKF